MKENNMFGLLKKCAMELHEVKTFEETIRCYMNVFKRDFDIRSMAYIVLHEGELGEVYELGDTLNREFLLKEAKYLLRNPELEYKKSVFDNQVEYLYQIETNAFLILKVELHHNDFNPSEALMH